MSDYINFQALGRVLLYSLAAGVLVVGAFAVGARTLAHKLEESAKHLIMDSVLFEEFGFPESEDSRLLRYAITGTIAEYLEGD